MDKMKMRSLDGVARNIEMIGKLFPNVITEVKRNGKVEQAIDFDALKQELSNEIVEGREERYQFTWPDKQKAKLAANAPISATLRPVISESVGKDGTEGGFDSENLYIEGDNLDVLKALRETYLNKVKMIYIDPPYNTGNDFVYEDNFAQNKDDYMENSAQYDDEGNRMVPNLESNGRLHTDWLNMIYPRLKVAKDLLTDDGVIFISIDDHEQENLKKICDELFGESNFISNIIWQSTAGSNTGNDIVTITENILVYTKKRTMFSFDGVVASSESYIFSDKYESIRGKYALDKLDRRRVSGHYTEALNYFILMPDGTKRYPGGSETKSLEGWNYLWSKSKVEWGMKNGFIEIKKVNGQWNVYNKRYKKVDNEGKPIERIIPFRNLILSNQYNTAQGTAELRKIFGFRPFDFPKSSAFIRLLLNVVIRKHKQAIVMDFFSGSASTAHAVMKLNAEDGGHRKFIMVQIPEKTPENSEARKAGFNTICDIGKERIRRAGQKIKEDAGLTAPADLDIGFRCLRLDSSNMKPVYYSPDAIEQKNLFDFVDNVKEDRSPEDLLFQVMLEFGVPLSSDIEVTDIAGKKVFTVSKGFLIACFDRHITDETVTAIAKQKPTYVVFRDSSFADDSVAMNFNQIFDTYSPDTIRKVL